MVFTSELQLESVFASYSIEDWEEVQEFLGKNTSLIPVVIETYQNIEKYFSFSKVRLSVEIDPEDGTVCLAAHVIPTVPLEEALKQLREFDHQWWVKAVKKAGSLLYVDLRFS